MAHTGEGGGNVTQHRVESAELQVHCLGNSADLGALRRSLEARGFVSRSRLTPTVQLVVADFTVRADHPTLVAARELGIEILDPVAAVDRLLGASGRTPRWAPPQRATRTPMMTLTVLLIVGFLALLGFLSAMIDSGPREATVQEFTQTVDQR